MFSKSFSEFIAISDYLCLINCSQTKFVAIILVLSVFFYAIFRLTNFSSDALTFRPQKRDKQVAPSGHYVLLEPFRSVSAQTVLETYTYTYGVRGGS